MKKIVNIQSRAGFTQKDLTAKYTKSTKKRMMGNILISCLSCISRLIRLDLRNRNGVICGVVAKIDVLFNKDGANLAHFGLIGSGRCYLKSGGRVRQERNGREIAALWSIFHPQSVHTFHRAAQIYPIARRCHGLAVVCIVFIAYFPAFLSSSFIFAVSLASSRLVSSEIPSCSCQNIGFGGVSFHSASLS